jgi:hypothetical protein
MIQLIEGLKLFTNFGVAGLLVWFMWRLTDKWAGLFLGAQKDQAQAMSQQAAAMTSLAAAMKEGQAEARDVLMAVRLLSDQMDRQRYVLERIEKNCAERSACPK